MLGKYQTVYHIKTLLANYVNISMFVILKISDTLDVMIENATFLIDIFCIWINEI